MAWVANKVVPRGPKKGSSTTMQHKDCGNDNFSGPTILVHKGDTIFVHVHNHGKYGITIY